MYCLTDPIFYDSLINARAENLEFEVARRPVPQGWQRFDNDGWLIYQTADMQLPLQGWKIHVSACMHNAEEILATVWDYCIARGISFKFLCGRHILYMANSKYAGRGGSGKLVTIYPVDEAELELVLKEVGELLEGQPGPYILSDLRWGSGPLYVRYGGFAERYRLSEQGEWELAMEDPTGELVPDRREPTFKVPPWVTLPDFLVPHLAARNSTTVTDLPYNIERALHFSNGGGLYLAQDRRTGEQVVLREARPHAGLAADGTDAVTRLQHERAILERLAGLDVAPGLRDYFMLGEHHFLVQDFVQGQPLNRAFIERYPLIQRGIDQRVVAEYTAWALAVLREVEQTIAALHERGIVFGDLHVLNIMLLPDDRVRLIDFEVAAHVREGGRPSLANPAFAAPPDRTGFDIDRYALACLRLFMFLPLTYLLPLELGKAEHLAEEIAERFPVTREFLEEALQVIIGTKERQETDAGTGSGSALRHLPLPSPGRSGWERTRESMTQAILTSATPDRDDRLFPGDIEQFNSGGLNVAYGAAGVLYALSVTGAGRYPEHEEWLTRQVMRLDQKARLGFYDGLHGVAYVLAHLGYRGEALRVLDMCLAEKWERLGLDLFAGLAGVGLNVAHLAAVTGDASLRDTALRAADMIADRLGDEDSVPTVSGGDHPYAGLMRGSSGPGLLFVRLYELTGDSGFLDLAATALRQDLRRCMTHEDGGMEVNEGWRTMPYLATGSVGIGLVLDDYLVHRQDERFADASAAIRGAAEYDYYAESQVFDGRAGIILYLSRSHRVGAAAKDPLVADHVRRLAWHAMPYQGYLAFPGEQLLRLSMDLATGTAGVLLALGAALHDEPVGLPFLNPRQPSSFSRSSS
ncbi:MAG: class III lanthionine synthetase LanKC [Egibacteraceae bacterium]